MTAILKNAQMFRHGVFSRGDVSADMGARVSRGGSDSPFSVDASSFVILPLMFMYIFGNRVFLIRRPFAPAPLRRLTAAIRLCAPCRT